MTITPENCEYLNQAVIDVLVARIKRIQAMDDISNEIKKKLYFELGGLAMDVRGVISGHTEHKP